MLEEGTCIVYGNHGLCRIEGGLVPPFLEKTSNKLYYQMTALMEKNARLYVPVEGAKDKLREALTAPVARTLLEGLSGVEPLDIEGGKRSESRVADLVRQNDPQKLPGLIRRLYQIKFQRDANGKKFATVDEKYLLMAERLLSSELAYALESEVSEIRKRIEEVFFC